METLKERLVELRTEKNLTQKELADEIGVSASAIGFWENGINEPKANYVLALAKFFDVSTDYLLGNENESGFNKTAEIPKFKIYSKEEAKLIDDYRTLNFACKKLVKQTIETLKASSDSTAGKAENK